MLKILYALCIKCIVCVHLCLIYVLVSSTFVECVTTRSLIYAGFIVAVDTVLWLPPGVRIFGLLIWMLNVSLFLYVYLYSASQLLWSTHVRLLSFIDLFCRILFICYVCVCIKLVVFFYVCMGCWPLNVRCFYYLDRGLNYYAYVVVIC